MFQNALEAKNETLHNGDVLIIASKVVSYAEGMLFDVDGMEEFRALIRKEADKVLEEGDMVITMKNKILIPNAGIDNSNTPDGEVVLWPKKPFESARKIRKELMSKYDLETLGVLITDSHCQPLRMGTSGIGIGWAGFEGVQDERGAEDLFGRKMVYTKIAVADNLSSAATLEMGETNASIPFVIARNANVRFSDAEYSEDDYFIAPEECIYKSFYSDKLKG